jgi:hypothetical protein
MTTPHPVRFALIAVLSLGLLASCIAPPGKPIYPDIRFDNEPPLLLDVASIDVRNEYVSPGTPANVEQRFPVTPARAAELWAHDRLKANGKIGRARFTITDAGATETNLPQKGGITGAFTDQPAERYDVTLAGRLDILDDHGFVLRTASVKAFRSQSVLASITPNDRDQAWYDMTKSLITDFDHQMATEMRNNFGYYLMSAATTLTR